MIITGTPVIASEANVYAIGLEQFNLNNELRGVSPLSCCVNCLLLHLTGSDTAIGR